MPNERMTLKERLRFPQYVTQGEMAYLDISRARDDMDAAVVKISKLEQTLDEIPRLLEVAFREWKKDESLRDMLDEICADIAVLRIIHSTDEEAMAEGIEEYGSEEGWREAMATFRAQMLSVADGAASDTDRSGRSTPSVGKEA